MPIIFFLSFCLHIQVSLKICTDAHQNNIILRSACALKAKRFSTFSSARGKGKFDFFNSALMQTGKALISLRRYGG